MKIDKKFLKSYLTIKKHNAKKLHILFTNIFKEALNTEYSAIY